MRQIKGDLTLKKIYQNLLCLWRKVDIVSKSESDDQALTFNSITNILTLEDGGDVDLSLYVYDGIQTLKEEPLDPATDSTVTWTSNGTGTGDAGDVMMKINSGGTVKTVTLVDFSAES